MKNLIILTSFVLCSYAGSSQELGVRLGDVLGNTIALDAVFGSGEFHRIHADLSFGSDFGLEVLWDFVYRPFGGEAFYYYLGVGPSMLFGDNFLFGISGEAGLEYHFYRYLWRLVRTGVLLIFLVKTLLLKPVGLVLMPGLFFKALSKK